MKIRKEIDLSKLPKWGKEGKGNEGTINWKEAIGSVVKFIYNDIKGDIKITNYNKDTKKLTTIYNNGEFEMTPTGFQKCQFGKILGEITSEFKIEIGQTFKDDKRDIIITDRKKIKANNGQWHKYYKYKCNKCGFDCGEHYDIKNKEYKNEYLSEESGFNNDRKTGCNCCINHIIVKGINDIATTHPHLVKYFKNTGDTYINSYGNNNKVWFICADCGCEKEMIINDFVRKGLSCNKCGDGQSYQTKLLLTFYIN